MYIFQTKNVSMNNKMPHKRKVKKEPPTKLLFEPENSFLYLRETYFTKKNKLRKR